MAGEENVAALIDMVNKTANDIRFRAIHNRAVKALDKINKEAQKVLDEEAKKEAQEKAAEEAKAAAAAKAQADKEAAAAEPKAASKRDYDVS